MLIFKSPVSWTTAGFVWYLYHWHLKLIQVTIHAVYHRNNHFRLQAAYIVSKSQFLVWICEGILCINFRFSKDKHNYELISAIFWYQDVWHGHLSIAVSIGMQHQVLPVSSTYNPAICMVTSSYLSVIWHSGVCHFVNAICH